MKVLLLASALLASAHATNLRLDAKPTSVFDDLMTTLEDVGIPKPAATTAPKKTNKNEVAGSVANIFGHVSTAKVKEAEKAAEEEVKEAKKDGPKAAQEEKHEHDEHHDSKSTESYFIFIIYFFNRPKFFY
jgi:hypothetical protein